MPQPHHQHLIDEAEEFILDYGWTDPEKLTISLYLWGTQQGFDPSPHECALATMEAFVNVGQGKAPKQYKKIGGLFS